MIPPEVDLRDIRTFLTLTEELHFGRTAERLLITPSRVSQTIKALESRVGGRLFDRTSRSVRLTPAGEQLRAAVTRPYLELQQAFRAHREAAASISGTLRIGMYTESLGGRLLIDIVQSFEAAYPDANVALTSLGLQRNYLDALRAGDVDMLATRLPISDLDIAVGPVLTREERVLLVSTRDPLAERSSVTLDDFAERAVSDSPAFPREMMNALIPPVTPSGRVFRRRENASIADMLMSIATGKQVHLTVPSFLEYHSHPAVTSVRISGLPSSQTALVWLSANRSDTVGAFTRIAATELAQVKPGAAAEGRVGS